LTERPDWWTIAAAMEATARRVRGDRNRRRLPHRGAISRWARRVTGLLATAAFLGVGVASYKMIAPDHSTPQSAALAPVPTATPAQHHKAKHHRHKPAGLTKAQKAARTAAVAELRGQGYVAVRKRDYDPRAALRVLIGRPVGDAAGGAYAFFFNGAQYLGRDALSPSVSVKVAGQTPHSVLLSYRTCCPVKHTHVRFRLEAGGLHALSLIPPSYLRAQR
jgi:LppP/LprE lipoprotein